jgi:hypothetical protein
MRKSGGWIESDVVGAAVVPLKEGRGGRTKGARRGWEIAKGERFSLVVRTPRSPLMKQTAA